MSPPSAGKRDAATLAVFLSSAPGPLVASESRVLKGFSLSGRVTLFSTGSFLNGREMSQTTRSEAICLHFLLFLLILALLHA